MLMLLLVLNRTYRIDASNIGVSPVVLEVFQGFLREFLNG